MSASSPTKEPSETQQSSSIPSLPPSSSSTVLPSSATLPSSNPRLRHSPSAGAALASAHTSALTSGPTEPAQQQQQHPPSPRRNLRRLQSAHALGQAHATSTTPTSTPPLPVPALGPAQFLQHRANVLQPRARSPVKSAGPAAAVTPVPAPVPVAVTPIPAPVAAAAVAPAPSGPPPRSAAAARQRAASDASTAGSTADTLPRDPSPRGPATLTLVKTKSLSSVRAMAANLQTPVLVPRMPAVPLSSAGGFARVLTPVSAAVGSENTPVETELVPTPVLGSASASGSTPAPVPALAPSLSATQMPRLEPKIERPPVMKLDQLPALKQDRHPSSKQDQPPVLKQEKSQVFKQDQPPALKREQSQILKQDPQSPSKQDQASGLKKERSQVFKPDQQSPSKQDQHPAPRLHHNQSQRQLQQRQDLPQQQQQQQQPPSPPKEQQQQPRMQHHKSLRQLQPRQEQPQKQELQKEVQKEQRKQPQSPQKQEGSQQQPQTQQSQVQQSQTQQPQTQQAQIQQPQTQTQPQKHDQGQQKQEIKLDHRRRQSLDQRPQQHILPVRRTTMPKKRPSSDFLSLEKLIRDGPTDGDLKGSLDLTRLRILDQGIKSDGDGMSSLRIYVWLILLNAPLVETDAYLALIHRGASPAYSKIRNDTFRTLATDPLFRRRVSEASLIRLLNAVAWKLHDAKLAVGGSPRLEPAESPRSPSSLSHSSSSRARALTLTSAGSERGPSASEPGTYVQGMNVLAAPFLYAARSEAEAFSAFHAFLTASCPGYVRGAMDGVHRGLALVDRVLAVVDPRLSAYLIGKGMNAELYAFPSVLTLCACTPPLPEVLRLWDFLFAYGPHLNILCIVAQLVILRNEILRSPSPTKILRSFPPLQAQTIKELTLTLIKKIPDDVYAEIVAHAK